MTVGGFEHLTETDNFLMKRVAGGPHRLAGFWMLLRCHPMDAVLLNETRGDFGQSLLPEKGEKVDAQSIFMPLNVNWTPLAGGQRDELAEELIGGVLD